MGDFLRPFHRRAGDLHEIAEQQRVGDRMPGILLAGGHHQRGLADAGIEQVAHAVAKPAGGVQVEEAGAPGGLGIAIRHRHRAGFLQSPDIADIRRGGQRVHQRELGGAGVAEDVFDPLAAQDFQEQGGAAAGRHAVQGRDGGGCHAAPQWCAAHNRK
jgi:hypothetical protein